MGAICPCEIYMVTLTGYCVISSQHGRSWDTSAGGRGATVENINACSLGYGVRVRAWNV